MVELSLFDNPFFLRALLALLLFAPLTAMLGIQVVERRLAFFSDAIGHSAFTGIAIGLLLHLDAPFAVVLFALLCGAAMTWIEHNSRIAFDTAIGVVYSFVVALGIVLVTMFDGQTRSFQSFVYGDILAIGSSELLLLALLLPLVFIFYWRYFNANTILNVNEDLAASEEIPLQRLTYANNLLLALVTAIAIRAVGILLVTALMIVPAATARNLAASSAQMFWYTILLSLLSCLCGFFASIALGSATGATIILIATLFFLISSIVSIKRV